MTLDATDSKLDHGPPLAAFGIRWHIPARFTPLVVALPIVMRLAMKVQPNIPTYMAPVCDVLAVLCALQLVWMASWRVVLSSSALTIDLRLNRRTVRWSDVRAFETTKSGLLIFRTDQRKPVFFSPKAYRRSKELRAGIVGHLGEPTLVEAPPHFLLR